MIINKFGEVFEYEGAKYEIGKPVIGTAESEYNGLFGYIKEIRTDGDKETENETPDLYCCFNQPVTEPEIKALEVVFSELYDEPKTLEDIILDEVILAPSMIKPLIITKTADKPEIVYVMLEDWAIDDEYGHNVAVYTDHDIARYMFEDKLRSEMDYGYIKDFKENEKFLEEYSYDSYTGYIDGSSNENHYSLSIEKVPIVISPEFVNKMKGADTNEPL